MFPFMNLEFKYQNELKLEFRITGVSRYNTMLVSRTTARPRDTRILVPEKNRAAQNRAS